MKIAMSNVMKTGRRQEIDIAKGLACFLMIAAHLPRAKWLPAGTFAAALFFAFSGMNVLLHLIKTMGRRCFTLFHWLVPLWLFFGGVTQVAIVHYGRWRIIPEFLQFIALAMLLLFALGKILKDARRCGYFFPVPFLVQQLLPWSFQSSFQGSPLAFLFGQGFALFPWLGFVLFGVFILDLRQRLYRGLQAVLLGSCVVSYAAGGIPLHKFRMSLTYILLALSAIMLAFSLGRAVARRSDNRWLRSLAEFFALPGRNSLMFVYLHYFVLRFFIPSVFIPSVYLLLLLQSSCLFLLCVLMMRFYEKVKNEPALLFPALGLAVILGGLHWGGLVKARGGWQLADMVIGILFAFLYVQLRRRWTAFCEGKTGPTPDPFPGSGR
jgi:hypothetical protein